VILSLEMHCSPPQQEVCARLLKEILGAENIYTLPENIEKLTDPDQINNYLPSPNELKYKYIVKCKANIRRPEMLTENDKEK